MNTVNNTEYETLVKNIKHIGINKGDTLVVHSSFKSLQSIYLTPNDIINALLEVLTEEGTLLMPSLSYTEVHIKNPIFNYQQTKSCTGIISETFRQKKGVYRSMNPIHSYVAFGKNAKELTSYHHLDKRTLDWNSPLYLSLKYNPKLLMLGCSLLPNTFMHLVENHAEVPYREIKKVFNVEVKIDDKKTQTYPVELPDMSSYLQRYDRVTEILNQDEIHIGSLLNAKSYLIDMNALYHKGISCLKHSPFFFVDKLSEL